MTDPELLAFAGACPAAVCRLVFNSVRISESAAPATLSLDRSIQGIEFRFSAGPNIHSSEICLLFCSLGDRSERLL